MATNDQNEVTLDTLGETLEPTKAPLVREGVWHNYRGRFRAEVRSFWRERYATTNIGMSNVTNAPDGFVAGPNGQGRAEGFFDYERKLRDGASFAALSDAHKQRQDLLQENMNRASAPDRERLTLLGLAEEASFSVVREANRPSLVREHGKLEALAYEADAAFAKLMDYDRKWNHPIMDPDRDFDTRPVTDQERLNWLTGRTDANGQSRKAENAFRISDLSEAQYFEGSTELPHVHTKELIRPAFDAPIAIRTDMQQETQRREEDEKARAAERHARDAVERERLATAKAQEVPFASPAIDPVAPPFVPEPDMVKSADRDGERYIRGTLKEVGRKPYENQTSEQGYAIIETREIDGRPGKTETVWGKNVPGAFSAAGLTVGDTVELRKTTTKDVLVTDEQTHVQVQGTLNSWVATKHDFDQHLGQQIERYRATYPNGRLPGDPEPETQVPTHAGYTTKSGQSFAIPSGAALWQQDAEHAEPLKADMINAAAKSLKIERVEDGVARYSIAFNGNDVRGEVPWNSETGELGTNRALSEFAYGDGLARAAGHRVSQDDRDFVSDVFTDYIGAATGRFVRERDLVKEFGLVRPVAERAPAVTAPPEVTAQAAQVEATPKAVRVAAAIPSLSSLGETLGASKGEPEAKVAQPNVESVVGQEVQPGQVRPAQVPQSDVSKPLDVQLGMHIESVRGSEKQADQSAAKLGVQPSPHLAQQQKQEQTREKAPALSVEETQRFQQSLGFKSRGIEMRITR